MSQASPPDGTGRALARSGITLAVATFGSGILGYAYILILTRSLGPEQYGVLGALLGLSVIFSVAFTAIQLEATRAVASDPHAPRGWLHRRSLIVSLATCAAILAAGPVIVHVLRLPSWAPVVALAAMMIPQTYLGVHLGILLGAGRAGAFAVLLVISGLSRTLAAVVAALLDRGPTFVLWTSAATAVVVLGLGVLLLRTDPRGRSSAAGDRPAAAANWSGMLRAALGAGALLVLLNTDVLAARAVLPDREAGWYAFLTVFGRVTFWGTNFIALWVFPHEAAKGSAATARSYALGAVALIGAAACGVAAFGGALLTRLLAGPEYAGAAVYAPLFAIAGSLVAVVQLATYIDVARARHLLSLVVWGGAVAMAVAIRWLAPQTIGGAIWATVVVLSVVAVAGLVSMRKPRNTVADVVPLPQV